MTKTNKNDNIFFIIVCLNVIVNYFYFFFNELKLGISGKVYES